MDDPVGAALALNRIGIIYYKMKKYSKNPILIFKIKA
jgi:hypothetical protein